MKKVFLLYILFIVFATSAFAQGYTGLIARWPFNGNANDVSGNGLNGTIYGPKPVKGYNGHDSTAYSFNGNGDFIYVPYNPLMNVTGNISICALVKPEGFYSGECQGNAILWRGPQGVNDFYELIYYDNAYDNNCDTFSPNHEVFAFGGGYLATPVYDPTNYYTPAIDTGNWYCVTVTMANDTEKMYVDGALKATVPRPAVMDSGKDGIVIGMYGAFADTAGFPYHLNAIVDEIRLYNRALSQQEAQTFCDSAERQYTDSNNNTSVNTIISPEQIVITPNPTTSIITVAMPHNWNGAIVRVVNSVGQQMIKRTLDGNTKNTIDLSQFPSGMYLLRVQYNNEVLTKKLIKN